QSIRNARQSCRLLTTLPMALEFLSNSYKRNVQSFPTRRSSDLMSWQRVANVDELVEGEALPVTVGKSLLALVRSEGQVFCIDNVDRKSTRLNSSHVKISYAVFCLKKKKHQ